MRTVSHRVSFHCLLLQGNKGGFRKPLLKLQNRANTPEEKYHQELKKLICQDQSRKHEEV